MDKRTLSLFAAFLLSALLLLLPASGQTCDHPAAADAATCDPASRSLSDCEPMAADSLERIDTVDSDLVALRRTAGGDGVVLEVAGFGLTLSPLSEEKMKDRSARVKAPRFNMVALYKTEVGFNIPTGTDYGGYPAAETGFFDLRGGKSFHLSTTLVGLNCVIGRQRKFSITTGLSYAVDNYRLSDNSITLAYRDGKVVPQRLDGKADKSKLRTTSLGIPLHLAYQPVRHLTVSLSGYFDFTMGANSIYKRPKEKSSLSGVNDFRFGVGASVSYYNVGVYLRYGVTPLFKSSVGPKVHPLSIGLCIGL